MLRLSNSLPNYRQHRAGGQAVVTLDRRDYYVGPHGLVRIHRLTGMRPAEVCQLRPCDIDRTDEVWTYRPESHKNQHRGRDRVVPLGPKAQAVLLKYLVRDSQSCSATNPSNWLG